MKRATGDGPSVILLIMMVLSACGGGGGGSGGDVNNNAAGPALSDNANLALLELEGIPLDQIFQPGQTEYTAAADFLQTATVVRAMGEDSEASISIDDKPLTANGNALDLAQGDNTINVEVTAEDGGTKKVYTLSIKRAALADFTQRAYIKAFNSDELDFLGFSVALSGDTLAIGAVCESSAAAGVDNNPEDNSKPCSGAVYIFAGDSTGLWNQQAYIKPSNPDRTDFFGRSVALDDDTLVVGAPFEKSSDNNGPADNNAAEAGAAYVFMRDEFGQWSQQAYLKSAYPGVGDNFGEAVAIDGDTIAVGEPQEDSISIGINKDGANEDARSAGATYVFVRSETGNWSRQAYIKASNTGIGDDFGRALALSGDTLAVGTPSEDSSPGAGQDDNSESASGAVYVYVRDETNNWTQQAFLKAANGERADTFGSALALDANTLAVSAILEDSRAVGINGDPDTDFHISRDSGAVYVFVRDDEANWSQHSYIKASNSSAQIDFGSAVALVGDKLVVGADAERSAGVGTNSPMQDDNSVDSAGAAYLFLRDTEGNWSQQAYIKASNTDMGDQFGRSVALSEKYLAVGATSEDGATEGVNGDELDNTLRDAGAVYLFQ